MYRTTLKTSYGRYSLTLRATRKRDAMGKELVAYTLRRVGEKTPIFQGDDLGCSPLHEPESRDTAMALLGFLTCGKGDVEEDYFVNYTPEQLEFADGGEAEQLATYPYGWEERQRR